MRAGKLHRDRPWREQYVGGCVGRSLRPGSVISMNEHTRFCAKVGRTSGVALEKHANEMTAKTARLNHPLMKLLRSLLPIFCAGLAVASLRATTVIPPTFDQLVSEAELIFEGTVTDARSQWTGEGAERHI